MTGELLIEPFCAASPTGRHEHLMTSVLSTWSNVVVACQHCGKSVAVQGARWVHVLFVIQEEPDFVFAEPLPG